MITCEKCGLTDIEEIVENHKCGASGESNNAILATPTRERPDGMTPINIGKVLVGLGFVMALFAAIAANNALSDVYSFSSDYTVLEATQEAASYWSISYVGGGILSLGIVLWCVGYIVHAISFLQQGGSDHD